MMIVPDWTLHWTRNVTCSFGWICGVSLLPSSSYHWCSGAGTLPPPVSSLIPFLQDWEGLHKAGSVEEMAGHLVYDKPSDGDGTHVGHSKSSGRPSRFRGSEMLPSKVVTTISISRSTIVLWSWLLPAPLIKWPLTVSLLSLVWIWAQYNAFHQIEICE